MTIRSKAIFCWSGGKDSAYCLYKIIEEGQFEVKYLLTTINNNFRRISIHGIREELLDVQVKSVGIPLLKVALDDGTNEEYESKMKSALLKAKSEGIYKVIFGDIFLEDIRAYREKNLEKVGMKGIFPLWKKNTTGLLNDFIHRKFRTVICCTNDAWLGEEWLGREIDRSFLEQLPSAVDPCGENGEYHTFCYDGPLFKNAINYIPGEKVYKPLEIKTDNQNASPVKPKTRGFWFYDLMLKV